MESGGRRPRCSIEPRACSGQEIKSRPEIPKGINDGHFNSSVNPISEAEFMDITGSTGLRFDDYGSTVLRL